MKGRGPEYHAKEQSRGRNRSAKMEEVVSPSIDFEMIWCLLRRESPLPLPVPYFIPLFTKYRNATQHNTAHNPVPPNRLRNPHV